jgi:hypothetical protein
LNMAIAVLDEDRPSMVCLAPLLISCGKSKETLHL